MGTDDELNQPASNPREERIGGGTSQAGDGGKEAPAGATEGTGSQSGERRARVGGTAAEEAALEELRWDLLARATRSVHYHEARARFLDFWRRALDFIVIVSGATATSTVIGTDCNSKAAAYLGLFIAIVGGLQLVLGLGEKAQEHRWLKKRVADVLGKVYELETFGGWGPKVLRELTQQLAAVYSDEPPTLRALDAICYNTAHLAVTADANRSDLLVVPWYMALTSQFLPWTGHQFLTAGEIASNRTVRAIAGDGAVGQN